MTWPVTSPPEVDSALWSALVVTARDRAHGAEPAHDFFHVERVVGNALAIGRGEGLSREVVEGAAVAALLHELFTLPKSHPDSSRAGDTCAVHARELLESHAASPAIVSAVTAAIRDHSFSKGVTPEATVSRVLQDADRLDALGAIGLARMWATCADMKRPFYAPEDPFCASRMPDDKLWGLDHVWKKLLAVPARLHTATARHHAAERVTFLEAYVEQLRRELASVTSVAP